MTPNTDRATAATAHLAALEALHAARREQVLAIGRGDAWGAAHAKVLETMAVVDAAARYTTTEIVELQVSKRESAHGLVRQVEQLIREHGIINATTRCVDSQFIHTLQAFSYFCELSHDPWSEYAKGDRNRVIAAAKKHCGINIVTKES